MLVRSWSDTGQILVRYGSNTGQIRVKYGSNTGRIRVEYWSDPPPLLTRGGPFLAAMRLDPCSYTAAGQILVKYWSNTGQILVKFWGEFWSQLHGVLLDGCCSMGAALARAARPAEGETPVECRPKASRILVKIIPVKYLASSGENNAGRIPVKKMRAKHSASSGQNNTGQILGKFWSK
jgi:hypothetical protein